MCALHKGNGFTLVKILIFVALGIAVIVIILGALATARVKGNDAAVKGNMNTIAIQAKTYVREHETYATQAIDDVVGPTVCTLSGTMFAEDDTVRSALALAVYASGGAALCALGNEDTAYAIQVPLRMGGYWCVDSYGAASYADTLLLSTAACP